MTEMKPFMPRCLWYLCRLLQVWLLLSLSVTVFAQAGAPAAPAAPPPSFAFYYGRDVPWEALGAFDIAVVEPGHIQMLGPKAAPKPGWSHRLNPGTQVAAYVSVGEVHPTREYFKRMRPEWKLGENKAWGSIVVDQAAAGFAQFYLREVIEPLWAQGYRAFFLDTLDSFYLVAKTPEAQAKQIEGMAGLIRAIKRARPEVKLIFNRGFEILPQVHREAFAVVAESLFQGWNAEKSEYREVPQADRDWLWGQLKKCRDEYGLPVVSIDYVPPENRALARETAAKIRALGAVPWVANPELNLLGVGQVELLPRQVLAVHDEPSDYSGLALHQVHRMATPPLNYLGLDVRYARYDGDDLAQISQQPLAGRYAGIVFWYANGGFVENEVVRRLIRTARAQGVPVVLAAELPAGSELLTEMGLEIGNVERVSTPLQLEKRSVHVGFEIEPKPVVSAFTPMLMREGDSWLRVNSPTGRYADVVAITPWGGYAVSRYWQVVLSQELGFRWAVDPVEFFRSALRIPREQPMPDVSTDSGRRLLLVHHDGDGFPSRAEIPGTPLAAEVMLKEFLQRYPVPTTVSVIESEVSGQGLYAALSPLMEATARQMFALPHVEIATHSYSHPFFWRDSQKGITAAGRKMGLPVPGYQFSIEREIAGSARYIDSKLAPPGKKTRVMLWTGDTRPLGEPVAAAYEAGLLNMNGGDTLITRGDNSLALIGPIGMMKGDYFQVYAPNQNENVYTHDWTGPFYGFERVIETFELTDKPRRFKPVNIYYHTYIASKRASINSLHKVYQWALAQPLHPVFASSYMERVLDWRRATVARLPDGRYELRSGGPLLRQWRTQSAQEPDWSRCSGVAGSLLHEGARYLHATNSIAACAVSMGAVGQNASQNTAQKPPVQLESANARLLSWQLQGAQLQASFEGHMPFAATVLAPGCTLDAAASSVGLKSQASGVAGRLQLEGQRGKTQLVLRCPQ